MAESLPDQKISVLTPSKLIGTDVCSVPDGFTVEGGLIKPNTLVGITVPTVSLAVAGKDIYAHVSDSGLLIAHKDAQIISTTEPLLQTEQTPTSLTKVARAIHNPHVYIRSSSMMETDLSQVASPEVFKSSWEMKPYFDKNTETTVTRKVSTPGCMEQYLLAATACIHDPELVHSEAPQHLSRHMASVLQESRLRFELPFVPEMPRLVEEVLHLIEDETVFVDKKTRSRLYEVLQQTKIPDSLVESTLRVMDKSGDLDQDLAMKLWLRLKDEHSANSFVQEQIERRQELLTLLSGSAQDVVNQFDEIMEKSRGLIDPYNTPPQGKIGIEVEYKPNIAAGFHFQVPSRFCAGIDTAEKAVEIRTQDNALTFDADYVNSCMSLYEFLANQPADQLKTLHIHLDEVVHPHTLEVMRGTLYKYRNERKNDDGSSKGVEVWGMGLPASASGMVHLLEFFAEASQNYQQPCSTKKLTLPGGADQTVTWDQLLSGYYCSVLPKPESRLALLMTLHDSTNLALFNPLQVLSSFSFGDRFKQISSSLLNALDRSSVLTSQKRFNEDSEEVIQTAGTMRMLYELWQTTETHPEQIHDFLESYPLFWKTMEGHSITFPDSVLVEVVPRLQSKDSEVNFAAAKLLALQPQLSESLIKKIVSVMQDLNPDHYGDVFSLLLPSVAHSEWAITRFKHRLQDPDPYARQRTLQLFSSCRVLPDQLMFLVMDELQGSLNESRHNVVGLIKNQVNLSESVMQHISDLLKNGDEQVKCGMLSVLRERQNVSELMLSQVLGMLRDPSKKVIEQARYVVQSHPISESTYTQLVGWLSDTAVSNDAAEIFESQTQLPELVIEQLMNRMSESNADIRLKVMNILLKQKAFSEPIMIRVADLLQDDDEVVRSKARVILESQTSLPAQVATHLVQDLLGENERAQREAFEMLVTKHTLPDVAVMQLMNAFLQNDRSVNSHYPKIVLRNLHSVPKSVYAQIFDQLHNPDEQTQYQALQLLRSKKSLPAPLIMHVFDQWKDHAMEGRVDDEQVILKNQISLPESITSYLANHLLDNRMFLFQYQMMDILKSQKTLSESVLIQIVDCMDDDNFRYKPEIVELFNGRDSVPDSVMVRLVDKLDHPRDLVRETAKNIFKGKTSLSEMTQMTLVDYVFRADGNSFADINNALLYLPHISDAVLTHMVNRLVDYEALSQQHIDAIRKKYPTDSSEARGEVEAGLWSRHKVISLVVETLEYQHRLPSAAVSKIKQFMKQMLSKEWKNDDLKGIRLLAASLNE